MFLGLDISTTCTGVCIIGEDGILKYSDSIKYNKSKKRDMLDKIEETKEFLLKNVKDKYEVKAIFIEDFLKKFAYGRSSANVIATLTGFNTTIGWILYEVFGIKPERVSFLKARKFLKINVDTKERLEIKKKILDYVVDTAPNFPYNQTKMGNPALEMFDRADAYVIAKYAYHTILDIPVT